MARPCGWRSVGFLGAHAQDGDFALSGFFDEEGFFSPAYSSYGLRTASTLRSSRQESGSSRFRPRVDHLFDAHDDVPQSSLLVFVWGRNYMIREIAQGDAIP